MTGQLRLHTARQRIIRKAICKRALLWPENSYKTPYMSSENKGTTIKKNDNVTMVLQSSFAIKECIPVGCVPAAHWPYAGVCSSGGGSPWQGGGLLGMGGGLLGRGSPWQGVAPQHALWQTPPVNRMIDRCKNITLATTSLRPVNIRYLSHSKERIVIYLP